MGFEHLWPLLFLAFVPGIVLLYLLKQKVQTKKVPALNLWQEAFESVQASTPWEKFRNNVSTDCCFAFACFCHAYAVHQTEGRRDGSRCFVY